MAARYDKAAIVRFLLEHASSIDLDGSQLRACLAIALHTAVRYTAKETVEMLLADPHLDINAMQVLSRTLRGNYYSQPLPLSISLISTAALSFTR